MKYARWVELRGKYYTCRSRGWCHLASGCKPTVRCLADVAEATEAPPTVPPPAVTTAPPTLINFTFWLWVGPDIDKVFSQKLTVPQNTSLFDAMKLAAERDSNFE